MFISFWLLASARKNLAFARKIMSPGEPPSQPPGSYAYMSMLRVSERHQLTLELALSSIDGVENLLLGAGDGTQSRHVTDATE